MTTAATRPSTSPTPGCPAPRMRRRGHRPVSICSGEPAARQRESLEVLQVDWVELLDHRVLQADRRHLAVRRDRRGSSPTTLGRVAGLLESSEVANARRRSAAECAPSSRGDDDLGGEPSLVGLARPPAVDGLLGVKARRAEGVLELLAEGAGRSDHEHRDDQPGADDAQGDGRPIGPAVHRLDIVTLLGIARRRPVSRHLSVSQPAAPHIGRQRRTFPALSVGTCLVLLADPPPPGIPTVRA